MKKLSFVTTCMGRLEHLKQALPLQQHPDCESIVVDWSCPDNCGDWVEENYPDVRVVRVEGEQYYHRAKARNAGLQVATGEHICNADADLLIQPKFFNLLDRLSPDYYITRVPLYIFIDPISGKPPIKRRDANEMYHRWYDNKRNMHEEKASSTGFMIFPRKVLEQIKDNGYDEIYDHTLSGGEDLDMRIKLLLEAGITERWIDVDFIDAISHTNEMRIEYIIEKNFIKSRRGSWDRLVAKWGESKWQDELLPIIRKSNNKL